MDSARVASCLGLDPSQYKSRASREDSNEDSEAMVRDEDKFRSALIALFIFTKFFCFDIERTFCLVHEYI